MHELIEMLYALDDVKRLAPYKWQTCDAIALAIKIQDKAKKVRESVLAQALGKGA